MKQTISSQCLLTLTIYRNKIGVFMHNAKPQQSLYLLFLKWKTSGRVLPLWQMLEGTYDWFVMLTATTADAHPVEDRAEWYIYIECISHLKPVINRFNIYQGSLISASDLRLCTTSRTPITYVRRTADYSWIFQGQRANKPASVYEELHTIFQPPIANFDTIVNLESSVVYFVRSEVKVFLAK